MRGEREKLLTNMDSGYHSGDQLFSGMPEGVEWLLRPIPAHRNGVLPDQPEERSRSSVGTAHTGTDGRRDGECGVNPETDRQVEKGLPSGKVPPTAMSPEHRSAVQPLPCAKASGLQ